MYPLLYCRPKHHCAKTNLASIVQRKKLLSDRAPSDIFLSMTLQSAQLEAFLNSDTIAETISLCLPKGQNGRVQIYLYRECALERFQLVARPVVNTDVGEHDSHALISFERFLPFIRQVLTGGDDADRALLVHVFQQISRMCRSLEQHVDVQGYRGLSLRRLTHLVREQLSEQRSSSVIRIDLPDECEELKREESPLRWLRSDRTMA